MNHRTPVRAKKHLGQHFLADPHVADHIAESILITPESNAVILEVGPGTGALTRPLLQRNEHRVHVIEVDEESIAHLQEQEWMDNKRILKGDVLHINIAEVFPNQPVIIAGNFPYNISSQILFKALDWRESVPQLVGMFQKEVAERICAAHGSKVYGILSVLIQTYYDAEYLFTVPPSVFIPPPKVQSGVLRLQRRPQDPRGLAYGHLKRVVKIAFNQRRKTLRNALTSGGLDISNVPIEALGQRAEQLSPEAFHDLARSIPS